MKTNCLSILTMLFSFATLANTSDPTSALEYQQATNTRIVVEENFLRFYTGGSERMTIDEHGNVGIGFSDPEAKLDIYQEVGGTVALFRSQEGIIKIKSEGPTTANPTYGNYIMASNPENNGYENIGLKAAPGIPQLIVATNGNVGIGTTSPSYKLHVNGDARANRFISNTNTYADYVFEDDYRLAPLSEVEKYIKKNNHLPDIPSESEARANGVDLQEMQAKLLQKIEELTLYVIEQNKENQEMKKELESQSKTLRRQQKEIQYLKRLSHD
ncbi:hypothetical protein N7E81_19040 [Reichenbachiella carrageenanivorans]|uniref:Uncharacterized protein n=1 Tax=Reichenbachiella carrageenanivorans TaxID=2979869 RepID=A0ABY6D024_9BACT|nr:hypothetical protein [Reichenbachiella carrageenanivorans]UXX79448.1 hypothetical protein N7E81_19040 [Reichenbachiella carrageenanivorans]